MAEEPRFLTSGRGYRDDRKEPDTAATIAEFIRFSMSDGAHGLVGPLRFVDGDDEVWLAHRSVAGRSYRIVVELTPYEDALAEVE